MAQEPGAVAASAANLFAAFLSLITTFIGEQLTTEMLRRAGVSKKVVTAHTAMSRSSAKDPLERLTGRQREVLQLLAEGLLMKEIAEILLVTTDTVAFHKYTIMERLGLKTSAELVQYALEHGMFKKDS